MNKVKNIFILALALASSHAFSQNSPFNVNSTSGQAVMSVTSNANGSLLKLQRYGGTSNYFAFETGAGSNDDLRLHVNNNWSVPLIAFKPTGEISMNGNVGIGTAAPLEKLHVEGNIYVGTNQVQFLSANGGNNRIQSNGGTGAGTWLFKSRFDHLVLDAGETGNERKILFKTAGVDKMLIDSDGKVGIGTTTPLEKLHVEGNIYVGTNQVQFLSASGGNNRIQSYGGTGAGTWLFKSRFDHLVLDAGETGNERKILFKTAGADRMLVDANGNVGIGTTAPGSYRLAVEGKIGAREVNVTTAAWSDYVFDNDYPLQPLEQVDAYIQENKHLPGVPSEAEVLKNGQDLGAMNAILLKKVEELTLYVIQLKKRDEDQQKEIENLKIKKTE